VSKIVVAEITLRDLLQRISRHLDSMASEVHGIEDTIGGALIEVYVKEPETISKLQRLDFLRQSMEDLALLMMSLSNDHDGSLDKGLAENLRLETTRQLVRGNIKLLGFPSSCKVTGEVDLF
jgi:hypothetical protein